MAKGHTARATNPDSASMHAESGAQVQRISSGDVAWGDVNTHWSLG